MYLLSETKKTWILGKKRALMLLSMEIPRQTVRLSSGQSAVVVRTAWSV